jgi:hypothetical protein
MKVFLLLMFFVLALQAQTSVYKKDSLQIKVYGTIDYKNFTPKKINILKVFCDYCNDAQIQFIRRQAWDECYKLRKSDTYIIKEGTSKHAIYLRVAKKYFRSLNKDE